MHYHLEIIMPPTKLIVESVEKIMKPFCELESNPYSFYDWYVIGGRFSGEKLISNLNKDDVEKFWDWCMEEKITVSSLTSGKQELVPKSQEEKVDKKWNEMFPSDDFVKCPLFSHSNDQYDSDINKLIPGDICKLSDVGELSCHRVIFAKIYDGEIDTEYMLSVEEYNGCNYVKTVWDGKIKSAMDIYANYLNNISLSYRDRFAPKDDWLVVTVDYHS